MQVKHFYQCIKDMEIVLEAKGLSSEVIARFNTCGDEISITVEAWEYGSPRWDGWTADRRFEGKAADAQEVLTQAQNFVFAVPQREDRDLEYMIQHLSKIIEDLPKGGSEAAQLAWSAVRAMIEERTKILASNGLPSPDRVVGLRG